MSKFLSENLKGLKPYVPGEQPKERDYIKLNTNESPFTPSKKAVELAEEELLKARLYPDPDGTVLKNAIAKRLNVKADEIILANGSDEVLDFCFKTFCDEKHPAVFADITYGFYKVFAEKNGVPYKVIPLKEDFSIDVDKFKNAGTLFIANPNAPTGLVLSLEIIEDIVRKSKGVVVVDEAYIDFGGESAVKLIEKYDNLIVTETFSKSRSMAGARLGFGVANRELIKDLETLRYSTNPYNVNRFTLAMGLGAIEDEEYFNKNVNYVISERERTKKELEKMGFFVTDSKTNFVFTKTDKIGGKELYERLKKAGVLVRHFEGKRTGDYIRITVGLKEQMDILLKEIKNITEEL